MNMMNGWSRLSVVAVVVCCLAVGCVEVIGSPVVPEGDSGGSSSQETPSTFSKSTFVFQTQSNQLGVVEVGGDGAGTPDVEASVLYTHPTEIYSFMMLRDRSGVVFTADKPAGNYSHAAYFIDIDGQGMTQMVEPIEGGGELTYLRAVSSTGGINARMWFTFHESTVSLDGTLTVSTTPISLENGYLRVHSPLCPSYSNMTPHFQSGQLAISERGCGSSRQENHITLYDNADFEGRSLLATDGDNGFGLHLPESMVWFDQTRLWVGLNGGTVIILDINQRRTPSLLMENGFSKFALSPDRRYFAGVRDGNLVLAPLPGFEEWWLLVEGVEDVAPSW